jgi:hypothetical protein
LVLLDKNKLKEFAFSQGAQLVTVTDVDSYDDYLEEVRSRLEETGVGNEDYLIPAVGNTPGSADESFFAQLSDPRNLLAGNHPDVIRRNAAIALNEQLPNIPPELKEYLQWAIEKIEGSQNNTFPQN